VPENLARKIHILLYYCIGRELHVCPDLVCVFVQHVCDEVFVREVIAINAFVFADCIFVMR